jgi:hypothetical protein
MNDRKRDHASSTYLRGIFIGACVLTLYIHSSFARFMFATKVRIHRKEVESEPTILLFLTTQASDSHVAFLHTRWPDLLNHSQLLRKADVMVFSTGDPDLNSALTATFSLNPSCTVINFPNPGYQAGANVAMSWAANSSAFEGYNWVIRLNPDVLILNDTWIYETMRNKNVDAIFVDCREKCSISNCTSPRILIHTDFFAIRPQVLRKGSFNSTTFNRIKNAEMVATFEFQDILTSGRHRWLPGVGPMKGKCRVRGDHSPVIHSHQLLREGKRP